MMTHTADDYDFIFNDDGMIMILEISMASRFCKNKKKR